MIQHKIGLRPLIFVCHSLGGLVTKSILRKASDSVDDPRKKTVLNNVKTVFFLATPHAGAELAEMFKAFRSIFQTTITVEELKAHDAHLSDLFDWYRNHSLQLEIETITYYEMRPVKGLVTIVNSTSSHPGVGKNPVPLDEDHLSIAKPRKRDAQVCNALRECIREYLCGDPNPQSVMGLKGKVLANSQGADNRFEGNKREPSSKPHMEPNEIYSVGVLDRQRELPQGEGLKKRSTADKLAGDIKKTIYSEGGIKDIDSFFSKVESAAEIATQIKEELSVWNNEKAFHLSKELKKVIDTVGNWPNLFDYLFLIARVNLVYLRDEEDDYSIQVDFAAELLDQLEVRVKESSNQDLLADIYALKASIIKHREGFDSAIKYLSDLNDSYAIRMRLTMHLSVENAERAVSIIEELPLDLKWCEFAVAAYAALGRTEDAFNIIEWSRRESALNKYPQCIVRFAQAGLAYAVRQKDQEMHINPQELSEDELANIRILSKALAPILNPILEFGSVKSELEFVALTMGLHINYLLGNRNEIKRIVRTMSTRKPISIDVARCVLNDYMEPSPDLPMRLRIDHPDDFNAKILSCFIEIKMGQIGAAYKNAKEMLSTADTDLKKEDLFRCFRSVLGPLDDADAFECKGLAFSLVAHNQKLRTIFDAEIALGEDKAEKALKLLDKNKGDDDEYWLQVRGNALIRLGRLDDAADIFNLAAKKTDSPRFFRQAADLAYDANRLDVSAECYEALISVEPGNLDARNNLASIYTLHQKDINKAVVQFEALHEADPDNSEYAINLAVCYAQLYKIEPCIVVLNKLCKVDEPDLKAILGRADVYLCLGRVDVACESLKPYRDVFWDEPNYLLACMNIGYAADDEGFAYEALCQLDALRKANLVDEKCFRLVSEEEVVEFAKEFGEASAKRNELIQKEMLRGRIPWVQAGQLLSDAIYWTWRIRTQKLPWVGDDPASCSLYKTYSTNGFHVGATVNGQRSLLRLKCPPIGSKVVVDLSALITLHRLGLLDDVADYFGELLIPQDYLTSVLEDGRKMVLHQRSRKKAAEEINHKINVGSILLYGKNEEGKGQISFVDEYNNIEKDEFHYHLIDIVEPLYLAGELKDTIYERVKEVCKKETKVDEEHPSLKRLQRVCIDLASLETLFSFRVLDAVTQFYRVYLESNVRETLSERLEVLDAQEKTRNWHFKLWDWVIENDKCCIKKAALSHIGDSESTSPFGANYLSEQEKVPLLADDRVCQAVALNQKDSLEGGFGSDLVISALVQAGKIDEQRAAKAILKLIKWRYYFILPSSKLLKFYAAQYKSNPPGIALQDVAHYVHDCMRNVGLFSGEEDTDSKESMAMRLYIEWIKTISDWIIDIWNDPLFSDDTARKLTEWCVDEFLPTQPVTLDYNKTIRAAQMLPDALISNMLMNKNPAYKKQAISNALEAVQNALRLSHDEYFKKITGFFDVISKY